MNTFEPQPFGFQERVCFRPSSSLSDVIEMVYDNANANATTCAFADGACVIENEN